jgi:Family of unknown function (DUF6074)
MTKQRDLFDDFQPRQSGSIIAFPVHRRTDLISEVVRGLLHRNEADGRRFWHSQVKSIRLDMKASGIPQADIDRQISELVRAVNVQLDYRCDHQSSM